MAKAGAVVEHSLSPLGPAPTISLFNAHPGTRCFQPILIFEATSGKPVAARHGRARKPHAPRRRRLRRHWPRVALDSVMVRHMRGRDVSQLARLARMQSQKCSRR